MTSIKYFKMWTILGVAVLLVGLSAGMANSQTNNYDGMDSALKQKLVQKRDPFWPVGYVPERTKIVVPEQVEVVVQPTMNNDWNAAMKKIVINGVSSRADNEFFAVINGRVKSVDDTITLTHEGIVYTWAVDEISPPRSVKLRRVSAL